MKMKIVVIGPSNSGKSRISNIIADANTGELPEELQPTRGVRILEFEATNVQTRNDEIIDVELWDCGGGDEYIPYWNVLRHNMDGIIFVYSPDDDFNPKKMEKYYTFFIAQPKFHPKKCLLITNPNSNAIMEEKQPLSQHFQKLQQTVADFENNGENLKKDFSTFLSSILMEDF